MKNNFLRVLKMTAFYSLCGLLLQGLVLNILLTAAPAEGQDLRSVKVSITLFNVSFDQVLSHIEKNTNFKFFYVKEDIPVNEKVTIDVTDESLYDILKGLAGQYGLIFQRINNQIVIKKAESWETKNITSVIESGTIMGKVLDSRSKTGIPGANLLITGLNIGAAADADGYYIMKKVPPGKHEIRISAIGYGQIFQTVKVESGKIVEADFILDEEAVGLDEVVVTGVAFETKRKEIPADIAVLTTKQIEEKNTGNFTDLLKGEIPGVFALAQGQYDDASYIYLRGSGFLAEDYAKIYIDGIELADMTLLSTISLQSIERIEVIRGAQAAALYGAEATGGVIQIITKKGAGASRLKIDAKLSTGYIESNYAPSGVFPVKTDNSLQFSGGIDAISYNVGVGYNSTGEWTKNYSAKTVSVSSGVKIVQGPVIANLTAIWSKRGGTQATTDYVYERWPGLAPTGYRPGMIYPDYVTDYYQTTLGLNITYQATQNWVHSLILGQDVNQYEYHQVNPHLLTETDTTQVLFNNTYSRQTVRYNTAYQLQLGDVFSARLTAGGEYSLYSSAIGTAMGVKFNEFWDILSEPEGSRSFTSTSRWTSGYSAMVELGYMEKLYFTTSIAGKTDPRGVRKTYIIPPRFGLTYTHDMGDLSFRIRGEYGTAIRPVNPSYTTGSVSSTVIYLPNPDLSPEKREGWDAGIEAYWRKDASLSVTRFSEEGKDAIMVNNFGVIDGIQTYQYINVGLISIAGYELQGKINFTAGLPFTLNVNYTYSDNIIKAISNQYVPGPTQAYQAGDRVSGVPKHSGGGGLTARFWRGSLGVYWQFSGGGRGVDYNSWYDYRYGSAVHRDLGLTYSELPSTVLIDGVYVSKKSITRSYRVEYPTYWKFNLRAEQELFEGINLFLNITNLFNDLGTDLRNTHAVPGRTTMLGVRASF